MHISADFSVIKIFEEFLHGNHNKENRIKLEKDLTQNESFKMQLSFHKEHITKKDYFNNHQINLKIA
ncbi:hypothetical protein GOQ29_01005 [Clostridium sp. D2Q-14]|uniref:hypothetical protein n=1 Tax=Anaeromonas gelatinilytica TaxID=2683194 RepID=UPI00193BCF72|nr:hypothetical protein [Anaeromonas gelatinilytica]MBS4534190.1 hypothetical protein [Anaeromonas gelatinilytica]